MKIKVIIYRLKSRKFFTAQWNDPITGKRKYKSTGTIIKREAERFAARLEDDIRENAAKPVDADWGLLRQRYEDEHLSRKSDSTFSKTCTAMDAVERIVNPKSAGSFREPQIVTFTNVMLNEGKAPPDSCKLSAADSCCSPLGEESGDSFQCAEVLVSRGLETLERETDHSRGIRADDCNMPKETR